MMHHFKILYIFFFTISLNLFLFSTANVSAKSFQIKEIKISEPFKEQFNKDLVIDKGFRAAFLELINLLVKSTELNKVKSTDLREIKGMIETFTIQEEKFINETYYLNLGVNFDKRKVYNYLEKKNIFPSQIKKEKFLFLPIFVKENTNDIFIYANNPIYYNWNTDIKNELIDYLLPTEDLEDSNIIRSNFDNIENYKFNEILEKYFIKNYIISLIYVSNNKINVLSKINFQDKEFILNNSLKSINFDNMEELKFFINKLRVIYEDFWKDQNQINTSIKLPLEIKIENENLNISLKFENILNEIDLISYYSIKRFDKNYIYYEIIFNGSPQNFIKIMNDRSYNFDTQNKIWILK